MPVSSKTNSKCQAEIEQYQLEQNLARMFPNFSLSEKYADQLQALLSKKTCIERIDFMTWEDVHLTNEMPNLTALKWLLLITHILKENR